jgi:hypothetical protein
LAACSAPLTRSRTVALSPIRAAAIAPLSSSMPYTDRRSGEFFSAPGASRFAMLTFTSSEGRARPRASSALPTR